MKKTLILFPDQLYPLELLPEGIDKIVLVEEPILFGYDSKHPTNMHVHKLILHRASMRRYMKEVLWPAKIDVDYAETNREYWSGRVLVRAARKKTDICLYRPTNDVLRRRLQTAEANLPPAVNVDWLEPPNFYLSSTEAIEYFEAKKEHSFQDFYKWQRERHGVLLTKNFKPVGGRWMFADTNPKKLRRGTKVPVPTTYNDNEYITEAKEYVQQKFEHYHGSMPDFNWPTNHKEATTWLDDFVNKRLEKHLTYQETLDDSSVYMYHSGLSVLINIGLLSPQQVIGAVLESKNLKAPATERFIRGVLGQREYVRGLYLHSHAEIVSSNHLGHTASLTMDWYQGTTGLKPVDDIIKKASKHGYLQASEKRILSMAMLMSNIEPLQVYRWYREMLVDSAIWTLLPNVMVFGQYASGGAYGELVDIKPSSYFKETSHYAQLEGWHEWSIVWDSLFWRFIDNNKKAFSNDKQMQKLIKEYDKLDEDAKRVLGYRAADFLTSKTA